MRLMNGEVMRSLRAFSALCQQQAHLSSYSKMRNSAQIWGHCHPKCQTIFARKFSENRIDDRQGKDGSTVEGVKSLLENSASYAEQNNPDTWSTSPYPDLPLNDPSAPSLRPKVDPSTTSVILFPGQGSQYVGMGKSLLDYPNVPEMYSLASEILHYDLLNLCLHGPKDMLDMTEHCQTAIMVASLAAVEKLKAQCPSAIENCVAAAGFSVGEYAALVFAGSLTFEDGVRLLKIRGAAMQKASEVIRSGMMTAFLRPGTKIKAACASAREWCSEQKIESPECRVATYLFADCVVIAGHMEALKFLEKHAADFGIRKMKYIPVSGAFHSRLMNPAKTTLMNALQSVNIEMPLIPVHSNVDGKYYTDPKDIRKKLAMQLCNPVKWLQTMNILFHRPEGTHFPNIYECGPGTTLRTVLKMINVKASQNFTNIFA